MTRKLCLLFLFSLVFANSFGQNQQILFDFDQLPQTLMLNPGAEVDYDKHFGVPFLSNIFFQVGATNKNITYNNIIVNSDSSGDIFRNIYSQDLKRSDYFKINQKLEIFNMGYRLKNPKYYLSFGMYQELDGFANYSKELIELYYEGDDKDRNGIPEKDIVTNFNEPNIIGDLVGVFHIGLSKKINERLNIGGRFKILSGSLNINSKSNRGNYYLGNLNMPYQHKFNALNLELNTSGLINSEGNNIIGGLSDQVKGLFFMQGNLGLGLDLGATYHASEDIIVSVSLLDLDYINYGNKVTTYKVKGNFELDDDNFYNPPDKGQLGYWSNVLSPQHETGQIPIDTLQSSYNNYRSPKLNTSVKYQIFRESNENYNSIYRDARYVTPIKDVLVTEFGIQTYTAFRPNKFDWAITAFFSRELTKYLNTKITYTYDKFSAKNIGLGLSTHIRDFNFYATADNLLALQKLKDSNYQSFQFGMNFIFD